MRSTLTSFSIYLDYLFRILCNCLFIYLFITLLLSSFWTSRGHRCRLFPPRFLPSIFIAHRVQQSHCLSISRRVLLTHALALSASQFALKKKSQRIYTSMHSGGFELTKLTYYTRLEGNLIRHRGEQTIYRLSSLFPSCQWSAWLSYCLGLLLYNIWWPALYPTTTEWWFVCISCNTIGSNTTRVYHIRSIIL